MRKSHLHAAALFVLALIGCSDAGYEGPETYPVKATVTKGGKPLPGISVSLRSEDPSSPAASGISNEQGEAFLQTGAAQPGAAAGRYKVVLGFSAGAEAYSGKGPPKPPFPPEWGDPGRTPKVVEVTAGGPNDFTVEL